MKKLLLMLCVCLSLCASAFAAEETKSEVTPDYQAVLGGDRAVVGMTDQTVMASGQFEDLSENKRNYPACRVKELFCDPYRQRAGVPDHSSL